ncbi:peptidoglycan-binding protein [Methylophaga sp. OBS3]|nr:peptidoglycan-binding protein [Methylophaga sp. OBS3]
MLSLLAGCVVVTELPDSVKERIIREHEEKLAQQKTTDSETNTAEPAKLVADETEVKSSPVLVEPPPPALPQAQPVVTESPKTEVMPAAAKGDAVLPGQCYVQATVYPQAVERQKEFVTKDSSKAITVVPARISEGYQQVVTKQSHTTYTVKPARFEKITEQIMVKPAMTKNRVVPAVYETRQETVVVEEATSVLEPCVAAGAAYAHSTGVRSFCAKEIPAKTQQISKQVLVSDERIETYQEPAEYATVSRWELVEASRVEEVQSEPEVEQVAYQEVLTPEQVDQRQTSEIKTVLPVVEYLGEPQVVTRRAVCDQDLDNDLLQRLQNALNDAGYNAGEADGYIGERTITALTRYQKDNGLAVGAITYESLEKLMP